MSHAIYPQTNMSGSHICFVEIQLCPVSYPGLRVCRAAGWTSESRIWAKCSMKIHMMHLRWLFETKSSNSEKWYNSNEMLDIKDVINAYIWSVGSSLLWPRLLLLSVTTRGPRLQVNVDLVCLQLLLSDGGSEMSLKKLVKVIILLNVNILKGIKKNITPFTLPKVLHCPFFFIITSSP